MAGSATLEPVPEGKTRIIHLDGGQERRRGDNHETRIERFDGPLPGAPFRDLFLCHYERVRRRCADIHQPGLAMVAVHGSEMAGMLWIAAKVGEANAAIVGRHNVADLYLDGDEGLSLRHLVMIVSPLSARSDEVRFRVIDLRTRTAFQDEHGRSFEALVAEGPVFLRCGDYALLCLTTGDPTSWPASAEDAWACIPERVYVASSEAEPDRWQRMRRWLSRRPPTQRPARRPAREKHQTAGSHQRAITQVLTLPGPVRAQERHLADGEEALGTLRIRTDEGARYLLLGRAALRRGILLGRYERCDVDGSDLLTSDTISRVHLLIVDVDGRLYAIDTASTNGTRVRGAKRNARILPVASDVDLSLGLGSGQAHLRWCPA